MKTRDLRIGNIFKEKYTGDILIVSELTKNRITFDYQTNEKWQAEPILLSEEILLKCGFDDVSTYKDFWLTIKDDKGNDTDVRIEISLRSKGLVFTQISDLGLREDLFHLHQLQNLYYALTGTELEISLD